MFNKTFRKKALPMKKHKNKPLGLKNEQGQTFIEFVLLLVMLIGISYGLLSGINGNVAKRWKTLVTVIVNPTNTDLSLVGE